MQHSSGECPNVLFLERQQKTTYVPIQTTERQRSKTLCVFRMIASRCFVMTAEKYQCLMAKLAHACPMQKERPRNNACNIPVVNARMPVGVLERRSDADADGCGEREGALSSHLQNGIWHG